MAEHLVIRIPADHAERVEWVVVDESGAVLGAPGAGPLTEAAGLLAAGRRVSVLLPATTVLRLQAELPVSGRSKLQQLLPFALEDQLAEDIDELHFAAGARDGRGRFSVAVIRRGELDALLAHLQAAGIVPQALYAESDGLPSIEGSVLLMIDGPQQRFMLRQAGGEIVAADLGALPTLLELGLVIQPAARPAAGGATPPVNLSVYESGEDADDRAALWEALRSRVGTLEVHRLPAGLLPRLAAQLASEGGVNLLQGPYARRTGLAAHWPRWQRAAALALATLCATLLVNAVEAWRLQQRSAALDEAIQQAFHYTFPDITEVRDARALLDSRLRAMGSQAPGQHRQFLEVLASLAGAIAQHGEVRLEAINYRAGSMELRLLAPSVDSLDAVRQKVSAGGRFQAEIQSANAQGDQVLGRMRITVGGA